jgi:nitrite reductase (NO-forming)
MAVIGVIAGAALTSVLAGLSAAAAAGVAAAPTVTAVVNADRMAFAETSLQVKNGEVLGLFLTNNDGIDHSFDIDALGIHVQLPPNTTRAVAIQPGGPGSLEFYCAIPGHREAGMVGTISVDQ